MPAVLAVSGTAGGAALFCTQMLAALRIPAGQHNDDVLALASVSLALISLAFLVSRR